MPEAMRKYLHSHLVADGIQPSADQILPQWRIAVHIPEQTNVQALNYGYDLVGNITTISDNVNSEVQSYGYDALNRLTSWTLNNGQPENYGYSDTTGNLSSKAGVTLQYTDGNHDHAVTQTNNNPYATYDANGNQVTRVWNGQTYTQTYDTENRLVSVKIGQTTIASFVYDGDGNRVQSIIGGTTTTFVGNYYEVSGDNITQYYYAGTQRVAMRKDGTLTFMLSDQLGSTSVTTDSSGQNPTTLEYDPWGGTRFASKDGNGNDNTPTNYRYTGQRQEPSFGLYFYQARWYDPATGRFAQADTVVPGGVQGYDRYAYVNNNPVNATDPTGHCSRSGQTGYLYKQCMIELNGGSNVQTILIGSFNPDYQPLPLADRAQDIYEGTGFDLLDSLKGIVKDEIAPPAPTVWVYANYIPGPKGTITVTGITVVNQSDYKLFVRNVTFVSKLSLLLIFEN
jgi:RHS repeat-associated protein